jgi:hypothetical protein
LTSTLTVPGPWERDDPPVGSYRLASHYLLDEGRLQRRETTVDIYHADVGTRTIDVECSLPNLGGGGKRTWYLPLAFFPKADVAPDLEVTYCDGSVIPVPTKQQNMALTKEALAELIRAGLLDIDLDPLRKVFGARTSIKQVWRFAAEVITREQVPARGLRVALEAALGGPHELCRLLRQLEDKFVLWVPVTGEPESHHQFRIRRKEIHHQDIIVGRKLVKVDWTVQTALGPVKVAGLSEAEGFRGLRIRFRALLERLPNTLAVRSLEALAFDPEASRSNSCHLRIVAPSGFLVRHVRAGEVMLPPTNPGYPVVDEIYPRDEDVVIQGWDQNLAHVHLFKKKNPEEVLCRVTLGPRGGAISLWMLTAVLTAALLWIVHHHLTSAPADGQSLFKLFAQDLGIGDPERELGIGDTDRQIAAAVLLVGPAFASAWSLRAEGGELLRSFLGGARFLLLLSATLSVAAALALAGLMPLNIDDYQAIEIYTAISYVVAMSMVGAWLLSRDTVWIIFRFIFSKERHNLIAAVVLALAVAAVALVASCPDGLAGTLIAACGLGLAMIGANSAAEPLRRNREGSVYRTVGGFGSIPVVILAGSFLGFYGGLLPVSVARPACVLIGLLIAISPPLFRKFQPIVRKMLMKGEVGA